MSHDENNENIATVTRLHSKSCDVVDDAHGDEEVRCVLSGRLYEKLKGETKPVAVGDRVRVDWSGREPAVVAVLPRRNCLRRPAILREKTHQVIAANVDRMLIVASVRHPPLRPGLIDRFLIAAGIEEMEGLVCINKIDLIKNEKDRELIESCQSVYSRAGYEVVQACATDGRGIEKLKELLSEGITLIVGHSGVGKSTILNAMDPAIELATGDISGKAKMGRHTTTAVRLLRLNNGGLFVDTPGIREFGINTIDPPHLGHYFPEIAAVLHNCRFPTCTHDHEPGCAVRESVEAGDIPRIRFDAYLRILKSL
jgi:ribosome biogenesis GTPase / thiamine phosphate phosphatase